MHWPGWKLLNCWARHSGERDSFRGTQPAEATRARSCWVRAATILFEHLQLVASLKIYINYTPTTCAFFLSSAVLFPLLTVDRRNRIFEHPFTLRQSALKCHRSRRGVVLSCVARWFIIAPRVWKEQVHYYFVASPTAQSFEEKRAHAGAG